MNQRKNCEDEKNICEYEGKFAKFTWRDEKTGHSFFLCRIKSDDPLSKKQYRDKTTARNIISEEDETLYLIYCNGMNFNVPFFYPDSPIKLKGYWAYKDNDPLGSQFVITDIYDYINDPIFIMDFLATKQFPDITYMAAANIIKMYGPDIYELTKQENASRLIMDACRMTAEETERFVRSVRTMRTEHDLFRKLSSINPDISYSACTKAVKELGERALSAFNSNPYSFGERFGLSFEQCDQIAQAEGLSATSPERMNAVSRQALQRAASSGDTWCTQEEFFKNAAGIMARSSLKNGPYDRPAKLSDLVTKNEGVVTCGSFDGAHGVANTKLLEEEQRAARNLRRIASSRLVNEPYQDAMLGQAEAACGIRFGSQQQYAASNMMKTRGISVLVGGPGTGKTTIIKGIIHIYREMHPTHKISLCAPTGRAAQRITETSGYPATTIHRLLEYKPFGESLYHKDESDPIDAEMIIVDETSMLDTELFDLLLRAVKSGTKLIFVGDPNQLKPVGPGKVLADLLNVDNSIAQKYQLTEIYRQSAGSPIIQNAYTILMGKTDLMNVSDFHVMHVNDEEEIMKQTINLVSCLYDEHAPFETQVLCPSWKGKAGVNAINAALQGMLNKNDTGLNYGNTRFKLNDKVIMMHNHYDQAVYYNGDIGNIISVDNHQLIVKINNKEITLTRDMFDDIKLAYAITIHKAQGSEFKNVIIALPKNYPHMLVNNLIYTAVTRSSQRVYIISEQNALERAITTKPRERRTTFLTEMNALE